MNDRNHAGRGRRVAKTAWALGMFIGLSLLMLPAWAQHSQEPQLDTTQPFVIRETYRATDRQAPPAPASSPGIIGLDMLIAPGQYPLVQAVLPGTPAALQGIQPGDRIIAVNGQAAVDRSLSDVDAMISDVPGDPVALRILRGSRLLNVRLTVVSLAEVSRALQSSYAFLLNNR